MTGLILPQKEVTQTAHHGSHARVPSWSMQSHRRMVSSGWLKTQPLLIRFDTAKITKPLTLEKQHKSAQTEWDCSSHSHHTSQPKTGKGLPTLGSTAPKVTAPPDHVQHSCAIIITNFHHLPLRYMGWDRELGASTPPCHTANPLMRVVHGAPLCTPLGCCRSGRNRPVSPEQHAALGDAGSHSPGVRLNRVPTRVPWGLANRGSEQHRNSPARCYGMPYTRPRGFVFVHMPEGSGRRSCQCDPGSLV
jgi:hypothetical protein